MKRDWGVEDSAREHNGLAQPESVGRSPAFAGKAVKDRQIRGCIGPLAIRFGLYPHILFAVYRDRRSESESGIAIGLEIPMRDSDPRLGFRYRKCFSSRSERLKFFKLTAKPEVFDYRPVGPPFADFETVSGEPPYINLLKIITCGAGLQTRRAGFAGPFK
jgi:hypothetical protein